MKFSIGGYNIRNFEKSEKEGYSVALYKNDSKIASVVDLGDGFIDVDFEPKPDGKEDAKFILNDMYNLLIELESILDEEGKYRGFTKSTYSAVVGFVSLLLDYEGVVNAYEEVPYKETDKDFYIVGSFGFSYFTSEGSKHPRTYFWKFALTHDFYEALKTLKAYAKSRNRLEGNIVAAAILTGEMDWNISFQDYAELHKPF